DSSLRSKDMLATGLLYPRAAAKDFRPWPIIDGGNGKMHFRKGKVARWLAACALAVAIGVMARGGGRQQNAQNEAPLPTGRFITPEGRQTETGSFPVNLLLSANGKYIVVTESGFRQNLSVLSAEDGHLVSQLSFNAPRSEKDKAKQALYVGLAFAPAP